MLDRLRQMRRPDLLRFRQVRDGAHQFKRLVERSHYSCSRCIAVYTSARTRARRFPQSARPVRRDA